MTGTLQLGLNTFGDITIDQNGRKLSDAQVIRNVVTEAITADAVGLDFFGVGEHHRDDFAVSAPEVVLAAIATRTEKIRLGSAVTVLSSDDPVRVYQRFATLDALSNGRAEVVLGRGSFTESFPLFGYPLHQYEQLFSEKLELFATLRHEKPVTWTGQMRASLNDQQVYPRTEHAAIPTWVGVGGNPESVVRAARLGLPLMMAIIGGESHRFRPLVDLYLRSLAQYGHDPLPIGVHSPGHIAATDEQALEELWPHWQAIYNRIGSERGWPAVTHRDFLAAASPTGALYVGSPETVAKKIATTATTLSLSRLDLKYSSATLPHDKMLESIHLYGTQVAPMVRELIKAPQPVA